MPGKPRRARVPVVVLSGGLGSGKTTVLNHLLARGMGRIGVVINDFGDIAVDAFLVRGHVDAQAAIGGGCLCCLADPSELDDALARMARPSLDLDVIVVEASGLAEPRALARMIVATQVRGVRFGGVIEVVDAVAAAAARADGDALGVAADHVRVASLLLINKCDRLWGTSGGGASSPSGTADGAAELAALEAALAEVAPATPQLRTTYGRLDPALVFDAVDRPPPTGQLSIADLLAEQARAAQHGHEGHGHEGHAHEGHAHEGHAHESYSSVSVDSPLPVDPARLLAFLESRPPGVYRVKGECWADAPGLRDRVLLQAVGGWYGFEREPWDGVPRTRLVAIGTGVEREALQAGLSACLAAPGEAPTEAAAFALGRHVAR